MNRITEATIRVFGNKRTNQAASTLDVRTLTDLPVPHSLSVMIPLFYEHQISAHTGLRSLILDALNDNVCASFEGAPLLPASPQSNWEEFGHVQIELLATDLDEPRWAVQVHTKGHRLSEEVVSGLALNHAIPLSLMQVHGEQRVQMMIYLLYGLVVWKEEGIEFPLRHHTWFFAVNGHDVKPWQMMQRALRAHWLPKNVQNTVVAMMIDLWGGSYGPQIGSTTAKD